MTNRKKIDQTDSKIIKILLAESRTSFTDIAKECNITIGAVRMRYKNMVKAGIINGQIMQVNPLSLGYRCIADVGIVTSIENEKKVAEFLKTKPYIQHIISLFGKYNFGAKVALKDVNQLTGIIEDLESNPYIKRVDSMIWADSVNLDHTENLIIKPEPSDEIKQLASPLPIYNEEFDLDEKDRQIAIILTMNSRMPFKRIAEKLGISTKNVIQRYNGLRGKILTLSSITVDLNKLGYNGMAHMFLKINNRSKMPEVYSKLLKIPNMIVAIRLIGPYDLFALAALEDFNDEFRLKSELRKIADIEKMDTFLNPTFKAYPLNLFNNLL